MTTTIGPTRELRARHRYAVFLCASQEELQDIAGILRPAADRDRDEAGSIAEQLGLNRCELVCAMGFNKHARHFGELIGLLGYADYEHLAEHRNRLFTTDVYAALSIGDVLATYRQLRNEPYALSLVRYLIPRRLAHIEEQIDATVNFQAIKGYRREVNYIYSKAIAQMDFADKRLAHTPRGFRALADELKLIIESQVLSLEDLLLCPTLKSQEKKRLLDRGLVSPGRIEQLAASATMTSDEKQVLTEILAERVR